MATVTVDPSAQDLHRRRHTLARCIRHISPGVIEVQREADARIRMGMLGLLLAFFIALLVNPQSRADIFDGIQSAINEDAYVDRKVDEYNVRYPNAQASAADIRQSILDRPSAPPVVKALFFGIPTLLFVLPLLVPRFTPVRFDAVRSIAYTWHRGRLYIVDLKRDSVMVPVVLRSGPTKSYIWRGEGAELAAWRIWLSPADGSRGASAFHLGTLPPPALNHWSTISAAVEDLIKHDGKDPDWLVDLNKTGFHWTDPIRSILYATLFPGFRINEAKTEPAIQAWLA